MAKAGFWAIGGAEISFSKDGRWYADGGLIENPRIAELFSRNVRPDGSSGWVIDIGIDRQPVSVEDTALVVVSLDGNPEDGFRVRTNDGEVSRLNCSSLSIGRGHVLYCDVDRGSRGVFRARFLRPAYYRFASWVRETPEGPLLVCGGEEYRLWGS